MKLLDYSEYAPRPEHQPPEPDWKRMEVFRDALPRRVGEGTAPKGGFSDIAGNGAPS